MGPDQNKSPGAKEKFQKASAAYETLSKPDKRKAYDNFGSQEGFQNYDHDFSNQNFDNFDLGNIFKDLFGGGHSARGGPCPFRSPRKGDDLQMRVAIDFMDAVKGCKKQVSFSRKSSC